MSDHDLGVATCRGCGMQREQTEAEWLKDHDHVAPYHQGECDCPDPYWCPGFTECGEFTWRPIGDLLEYEMKKIREAIDRDQRIRMYGRP